MYIPAAYNHVPFVFTSINFCPARFNLFRIKFNLKSKYTFKIVGYI